MARGFAKSVIPQGLNEDPGDFQLFRQICR
jgi:hypothetical protein